jgi:hypothetical protein
MNPVDDFKEQFCKDCKTSKHESSFFGRTKFFKTCSTCRKKPIRLPPSMSENLVAFNNLGTDIEQQRREVIRNNSNYRYDKGVAYQPEKDALSVRQIAAQVIEQIKFTDGYNYYVRAGPDNPLKTLTTTYAHYSRFHLSQNFRNRGSISRQRLITETYECDSAIEVHVDKTEEYIGISVFHGLGHPQKFWEEIYAHAKLIVRIDDPHKYPFKY